MKAENDRVFNDIAHEYRRIHSKNVGFTGGTSEYFSEYKILEIKNNLKITPPFTVLDVGCGDGLSGVFFTKHYADFEYFGIDVSLESIEIAKQRILKNCTYSIYNGMEIPFPDDQFDVILVSCVLHHIEYSKHRPLFIEMKRVLKPNGKLIVFEHNPVNPVTRKIVRDCMFDRDAILMKASKLADDLNNCGFHCIKVFYTLFLPRWKFLKPILPIEKTFRKIPLGAQYYIVAEI